MPDPSSRAKIYSEQAEECLRLATKAHDPSIAEQYRQLAGHYRDLAGFELANIRRMAGEKD